MKIFAKRAAVILVPIVVFTFALHFLSLFLHAHSYKQIAIDLKSIPPLKFVLAGLLTLASYICLMGYDYIGAKYIAAKVPLARLGFISFMAFSLSNSVGIAGLAGNSIRFRNYSRWKIKPPDILRVIAMVSISFWLGFLTVGGLALTFDPLDIESQVSISPIAFRAMGLIFLCLVCGYLFICAYVRKPLKLRSETLTLPSLKLAVLQITVASLDWILAASVLYVLLPESNLLTFPVLVSIYCTVQAIALITHVPGGVGILEALVVYFLAGKESSPASVVAALVAYRIIYYLVPLALGVITVAGVEGQRNRASLQKVTKTGFDLIGFSAPFVISWATFTGGAVLLWSAFTPAYPERIQFVAQYLHLGFIESSHFLSGLAGGILLILGRGLQHRSYPAYRYATIMLAAGAVFSILKGGDYEEGLLLLGILFFLRRERKHFYRQTQVFTGVLPVSWTVAVVIALIGMVWVGFVSYKHVEYSNELWTTFGIHNNAARFLRAAVGSTAGLLLLFFYRAVYPKAVPPFEVADRTLVKRIIDESHKTIGNLALIEDKRILFGAQKDAFIMYAIQGRSWIAMGDPIGNSESFESLILDFKDLADTYGGSPVFYQATPEDMHLYASYGMRFLKLGEEALVDLREFSLEGREFKNLRAAINKFLKHGATFEVVPKEQFETIFLDIKRVSDSWMSERTTAEKGFSLGVFKKNYLEQFSTIVVKIEGKIVAFANLWESPNKEELSIDLMRHDTHAPNGIMDALFVELLVWGKAQGYHWFNLGMAPLAGVKNDQSVFTWNKFANLVYTHGERFYNFQGLRHYKEKFHPDWQPRYLAYSGSATQALTDVTFLISGGIRGVVKK